MPSVLGGISQNGFFQILQNQPLPYSSKYSIAQVFFNLKTFSARRLVCQNIMINSAARAGDKSKLPILTADKG